MEELRLLAKKYYENTVNYSFYSYRGAFFLLFGFCLFCFAAYLKFKTNFEFISFFPLLTGSIFWAIARKQYDKNLLLHLASFTHLESKSIQDHKAEYLSSLTGHIDLSLFEVMKKFKVILDTEAQNRSFILDNGWYHFFKFLYDPESKNRILSLVIYLISLIALLTVVKPDSDIDIYQVINSISIDTIKSFLLLSIVYILSGYIIAVIPIMFIITYLIIPSLLKFSSSIQLSRHFISELNKYAFLEEKPLKK